MPVTTLSSFNDAATRPSPGRPRGIPRFAHTIGLLLLVPYAASALELGDATIKSGLGESLLVEIPYRLSGTEQVVSACVGVTPANAASDLPTYSRVSRISVTPTHIQIFDDRRVLEPLIGLNVEVHCAGAPHFVRSYQLFVDPPSQIPALISNGPAVAAVQTPAAIDASAPVVAPVAAPVAPQRSAAPVAAPPVNAPVVVRNESAKSTATTEPSASVAVATPARANVSARARGLEGGDLPQGQTYRVVRGDTLSGIAARITPRPVTINEAVDAIFAANPAAFTHGNIDLIEEGRSITIPNLGSQAALAAPPVPAPVAIREADLPTAAPASAAQPEPAPASTAEPSPAASVAALDTSQPIPAAAPAAAQPIAAPVPAPVAAPTRAVAAPAAPTPATPGRFSATFVAVLALAALILIAAVVAFVRRRRSQEADAPLPSQVREPQRRRPVELASRMDVVEGSMTGTHAAGQAAAARASTQSAAVADSSATMPLDINDLALNISPSDPVDFDVGADVGADVSAAEPVDESDRPYIIDARDDTMAEESSPTMRMADATTEPTVRQPAASSKPDRSEETIDDEKHTLTVVQLDMLRQDYETEHTLTQQASQELRDAVADLQATKRAHAATSETATLESPLVSDEEETAALSPTARVRAK